MTQKPASATADIQFHRIDRFSPQDMDGVIESAYAEHVQLGRGEFNGSLLRVKSDGKTFDSGIYSQAILGRACMPADRVFVGLVLPAQTGGLLEGYKLDLPTPYLYTECVELGCRLEPGTRWFGFQVSRKEIEAYGLQLPDKYSGVVDCGSGSRRRLVNEFATTLQRLTGVAAPNLNLINSARLADYHFDRLLAAFVNTLSSEPSHACNMALSRHQQLVRTAQEYMDVNMQETVRIRDLCTMLGVTYKTLERAFAHVTGVTPHYYLSINRLSHARRLLLNGSRESTRISDIALACGYDHIGRFSVNYRRWFGESPSQTLSSAS